MSWSTIELCNYNDLVLEEKNLDKKGLTEPEANALRDVVKEDIARKIRVTIHLTIQRKYGENYALSDYEDDLCDEVSNQEIFKNANTYGILYKFFKGRLDAEDETSKLKMQEYAVAFREALNGALSLINFDINRSGSIDADERFGGSTFIPSDR